MSPSKQTKPSDAVSNVHDVPTSGECHHFVPHESSDKLLIILSATGTKTGQFNMWKLAGEIPHNKLYLRLIKNDWYQSGVPSLGEDLTTTIDAIKSLADAHGIKEIYTCGSSMGGHGAILYGSLLDASVLAFSPETQMKLPFSRSSKMMPASAKVVVQDLRDMISQSTKPIHLYTGEMDPVDLYCADMVKDLPNIHVTTMFLEEHTVMRTLHVSGRLVPMLRSFLEGEPFQELTEKGGALQATGFAKAYFDGWLDRLEGRNDSAIKNFEKAIELYPTTSHCRYLLAMILLKLRKPEEALPHSAMAAVLAPDNPDHQFLFANCLRHSGDLDYALFLYRKILDRWPEMDRTLFDIGQIYLLKREPEKARAFYLEAARINPTKEAYRKKAGLIAL